MKGPSRRRLWVQARLNGLLTALLAALLLTGGGLPAAFSVAAAAGPGAYCFSWEFLNNTGQDADGLHIRLQGVHDITIAYAGPDNPFGQPLQSSGYDSNLDAYRLEFGGGPALNGVTTHLGVCTDQPVLRLGVVRTPPPFYWSSGSSALQPDPLFLGVGWLWTSGGGLRVGIRNDTPAPLLLWSLNLLAAGEPLALDDLGNEALATMPLVADLAPDVLTLPALTTQFFDIPAEALGEFTPGQALVLLATYSTEDDPGNSGALYAQLLVPSSSYLPLIMR